MGRRDGARWPITQCMLSLHRFQRDSVWAKRLVRVALASQRSHSMQRRHHANVASVLAPSLIGLCKEVVAHFYRMVNTTDIVELELKSKRFSLSLRKKEAIAVPEAPPVSKAVLSEA